VVETSNFQAELEELSKLICSYNRMKESINQFLEKAETNQQEQLKEFLEEFNQLEEQLKKLKFENNDLEIENRKKESLISVLEAEKKELEIVNSDKDEVLRDYEDKIADLNERIGEQEKEFKELVKQNNEQLTILENSRLSHSEVARQNNDKLTKMQENIDQLERDLKLEVEKNCQLNETLKKKTTELNDLKLKENSFHKKYNIMKQMFNSNDAHIKSLNKELATFKENNAKYTSTIHQFILEMKHLKKSKEEISSFVAELPDKINIDDIFEDNQEELSIYLSNIDNGNNAPGQTPEKGTFSFFKKNLTEIKENQLGSEVFDNMNDFVSPIGYEKSLNNLKAVEDEYNMFSLQENRTENKHIFQRNADSGLFQTQTDDKEHSIRNFDFQQLQRNIDSEINSKIRSAKFIQSQHHKSESLKRRNDSILTETLEMSETVKNKIRQKMFDIKPGFLDQLDREHIELKLNILHRMENFTIWLFDFFENKFRTQQMKMKELSQEKSN
jgi:DNA repair exonuclease SbcCD ATPase subunit